MRRATGFSLMAQGAAVFGLVLAVGSAAATAGPSSCPPARTVASGVFVVEGAGGAPTRNNRGRVGNTVILIGDSGVVIVDPGPTHQSGGAIACSARRLSRLPVVAVINTHPHPENVLANDAFAGVPIYAASTAVEAMSERCLGCQERLARTLGKSTMAETRAVVPSVAVATATSVNPGGRSLRLIPLGLAHSPGDLAIIDETTATLIGGDAATISELPDLRDGTTAGAIAALEQLQSLPVQRIVPGRGAAFAPTELARPLAYLRRVQAAATAAAEAGEWPPQFADDAEDTKGFARYRELHPLNLQHAFREAEAAWWGRDDQKR